MGEPLEREIARLSELRPDVRWFRNGEEAIGVGHGYVWLVAANGWMATHMQAYLGEWTNGIKQAGITR